MIAAVNVANLLLARGTARSAELATRTALGASRGRLMSLLVMEGGVLAAIGGLLGVALAFLATPALAKAVSLSYLPAALQTTPDIRVLGVAAAATILAVLFAGVLPALRLSGQGLRAE